MAIDTNKVLLWLKNFKYTWLLQNILHDPQLIELISNKLRELEQLLIQHPPDENELVEDPGVQANNSEVIAWSNTSSEIPNPIENANQKSEGFHRPTIRLKRIPLAEAETYLSSAWQSPKSKRGQKTRRKKPIMTYTSRKKSKKNTQTTKPLSPPKIRNEAVMKSNGVRKSTRTKKLLHPPSIVTDANIPAKNEQRPKSKRKLRAIDREDDDLINVGNLSHTEDANVNNDCDGISRYLGANGILSQTRKINETTATHDEDFPIQLHSRQMNQEKNKTLTDTSMMEPVPIDDNDDIVLPEDQQMLEQILTDNDSESLFTSLEMTHDKTIEISSPSNNNPSLNYDDCIEDITNDGIDPPPPPSSSSSTMGEIPLFM